MSSRDSLDAASLCLSLAVSSTQLEGSVSLAAARDATAVMETVMNALSTTMQSKLYSNYNCLFAAYKSQEHCLSELKQKNKQLYSERV